MKFEHSKTRGVVLESASDDFVGHHPRLPLMGLAVGVALGTWLLACLDRLVGRRRPPR